MECAYSCAVRSESLNSVLVTRIQKLCKSHVEVIGNCGYENVRSIGKGETEFRKCKRLNLVAVNRTTVLVIKLP